MRWSGGGGSISVEIEREKGAPPRLVVMLAVPDGDASMSARLAGELLREFAAEVDRLAREALR